MGRGHYGVTFMDAVALFSVLLALVVLAITSYLYGVDSRPGIESHQPNW